MHCSFRLHRVLLSILLLACPATAFAETATLLADLTVPKTDAEWHQFAEAVESLKLRDASQIPALRKLMSSLLSEDDYEAASIVAKNCRAFSM